MSVSFLRAEEENRLEMQMARRMMPDIHREEGALVARKRILLMQLRLRFGPLPTETERAINATEDANLLEEWLCRFATATTLESIGIVFLSNNSPRTSYGAYAREQEWMLTNPNRWY